MNERKEKIGDSSIKFMQNSLKSVDMPSLKTIIVVDDNNVNRALLAKILSEDYTVLQAGNGKIALDILNENVGEVAAVILDIIMPVMDGYTFLECIHNNSQFSNLPIIVTTENSNNKNELKALKLGAWDFVSKPYNAEIIKFRLKNTIDRSQLTAFTQLKYLAEYDTLTGIYNKAKFFNSTYEMINSGCNESFAFFRFDIDRFQLINSFFGTVEGDRLLMFISGCIKSFADVLVKATYGRMESDIFCFCMPYDEKAIAYMLKQLKKILTEYNQNYDIVPSIGVYIVNDKTISIETMYNRATLAAKACKGNYVDYYAFYNEEMSITLTREQEIVNEMNFALENEQFEIYFQPQYNIHNNLPCGAEALVRWVHPKKGLILPGEFISLFERNGFITKLDFYVWEKVCKYLHECSTKGMNLYPVSVNVSRVNLYNPKLVEILTKLIEKYHIDPTLFNLELTESGYTDNPIAMSEIMTQLQNYGFTIMMDDFGNGYSSLSVLKDIAVDILKIDMRFLSKTKIPGRGENIISSVIRMAKWLNIPVIAEGVEMIEQVEFLRSVGCDYVQGYYFARPMPIKEYEELCNSQPFNPKVMSGKKYDDYRYDDLFSSNPDMEILFGNALQAVALYEFVDDHIEIIRVNNAYYAILGHDDMVVKKSNIVKLVHEEYQKLFIDAFHTSVQTKGNSECEYVRTHTNGRSIWMQTKLKYVSKIGDKHILIGTLTDITVKKEIDVEMQKYRISLLSHHNDISTILIVDDSEFNRTVLKVIFKEDYKLLEAENGEAAIEVLKKNKHKIDLILLDIAMPKMDGKEFLQYKKESREFDGIPVIMITSDDSLKQQVSSLSLGANDYIIKPFIPEVVVRRVKNVLESNRRFKEIVREYNSMSEQVKMDLMTGLFNRVSAEGMITQILKNTEGTHMMLMFDIDNFKKLNDFHGAAYGDRAICAVAEKLQLFFRRGAIVARMGGDEFAVFIGNVHSVELIEGRARKFCQSISNIKLYGKNAAITCSVGITVSSDQYNSFEILYKNADRALYNAKCNGGSSVSVYGKESPSGSLSKWIDDAGGILDEINDKIYVCERDTYAMLYVNDSVCKFLGVDRESCKGRKCYDILMNRTAPCEFCSSLKMYENNVYTRIFHMPNTSRIFLMRGKNISWNGIAAHLKIAVDITKIENINDYLKEAACDEGK